MVKCRGRESDLFVVRERNWSRNASRNCLWDRYWRHAGQLLANYWPIFFLSLLTVPKVFANLAKIPYRFLSGDYAAMTSYENDPFFNISFSWL